MNVRKSLSKIQTEAIAKTKPAGSLPFTQGYVCPNSDFRYIVKFAYRTKKFTHNGKYFLKE